MAMQAGLGYGTWGEVLESTIGFTRPLLQESPGEDRAARAAPHVCNGSLGEAHDVRGQRGDHGRGAAQG